MEGAISGSKQRTLYRNGVQDLWHKFAAKLENGNGCKGENEYLRFRFGGGGLPSVKAHRHFPRMVSPAWRPRQNSFKENLVMYFQF